MERVKKWIEGAKGFAWFGLIVIGPWVLISILPVSCQVALGFKEPSDIAIDGMKDIIRERAFDGNSEEAERFMDCWARFVKDRATNSQKNLYVRLYKAHQQGHMERMGELADEAEQAGLPELTAKAHKVCK